jgi:hypothetical protein
MSDSLCDALKSRLGIIITDEVKPADFACPEEPLEAGIQWLNERYFTLLKIIEENKPKESEAARIQKNLDALGIRASYRPSLQEEAILSFAREFGKEFYAAKYLLDSQEGAGRLSRDYINAMGYLICIVGEELPRHHTPALKPGEVLVQLGFQQLTKGK